MQQNVKSEIDVLRKRALNVFTLVICIRIGKWPNDRQYNYDRIDFVDLFKCITWIYDHVTFCKTF